MLALEGIEILGEKPDAKGDNVTPSEAPGKIRKKIIQ